MAEEFVERARSIASGKGFVSLCGMQLDLAEVDHARVRLPYREEVSRGDELVQGGAISALIDVAGTAAAWCSKDIVPGSRGATVGMSLSFLTGGLGDLVADARVIRRGRRIVVLQVEVYGKDDSHVATGQVTYSLTAPPR